MPASDLGQRASRTAGVSGDGAPAAAGGQVTAPGTVRAGIHVARPQVPGFSSSVGSDVASW